MWIINWFSCLQNNILVMLGVLNFIPDRRSYKIYMGTVAFENHQYTCTHKVVEYSVERFVQLSLIYNTNPQNKSETR